MKQSDSCKIYNKLCNNSRSDNRFLTGAVFVLSKSIELKKVFSTELYIQHQLRQSTKKQAGLTVHHRIWDNTSTVLNGRVVMKM